MGYLSQDPPPTADGHKPDWRLQIWASRACRPRYGPSWTALFPPQEVLGQSSPRHRAGAAVLRESVSPWATACGLGLITERQPLFCPGLCRTRINAHSTPLSLQIRGDAPALVSGELVASIVQSKLPSDTANIVRGRKAVEDTEVPSTSRDPRSPGLLREAAP